MVMWTVNWTVFVSMVAVLLHVIVHVAQMLFAILSTESQYAPVRHISNQILLQKMDVSVPLYLAPVTPSVKGAYV